MISLTPRHHMENGKYNGSHKATSSNKHPLNGSINNDKKEKGIVEKLLNSYGFIECASTGSRVFFHYSEYDGDPNDLMYGGENCCSIDFIDFLFYIYTPTGYFVLICLQDLEGFGQIQTDLDRQGRIRTDNDDFQQATVESVQFCLDSCRKCSD